MRNHNKHKWCIHNKPICLQCTPDDDYIHFYTIIEDVN